MKIGWLILGGLAVIGIFIFYPGLFHAIVSFVQSFFHYILSFIQSHNTTNITGA